MAAPQLTTRVLAHLERRIAMLEGMLMEVDRFEKLPEDADFQGIIEEQRRRASEMEHLVREYAALLREWRTANLAPEERARVATESRRAEELSTQVRNRIETAAKLAQSRGAGFRTAINDMQRGQGIMRKYRTQGRDSAGYFDRNA